MIKTRLQNHHATLEQQPLMTPSTEPVVTTEARVRRPPGAIEIAKQAYHQEGIRVFFRGLGVCSIRAFIVNAVQVCLALYPRFL